MSRLSRLLLSSALALVACSDDPQPVSPGAILVRQEPLPPDTTCPAGGTLVRTGADADGDGLLGDAEIQTSTPVCAASEIWEGDVLASDWQDPRVRAALAGARVVTGDLELTGAVDLPLLTSVGGDLTVVSGARGRVRLPALRTVGGSLRLLGRLEHVDVGALETVGDRIELGDEALAELDVPALRAAGGLAVAGSELGALELPRLEALRDLRLADNPRLARVVAPRLARIELLEVTGSPALVRLDFRNLSRVGDALRLRSLGIADLSGFPELATTAALSLEDLPEIEDLRALTDIGAVGALTLRQNPKLVSLAGLEAVGQLAWLKVEQNPALTSLAALAGVVHVSSGVTVIDNAALADVSLLALRSIGLDLTIEGNPQLTDLDGLAALSSLGRDLHIVDNPGVPASAIAALRARLGL